MINKTVATTERRQMSEETNANNLLNFPVFEKALKRNIASKRDVNNRLNGVKSYHVDEAVSFISPLIFTYLSQAGFDFSTSMTLDDEGEECIGEDTKQITFLIEAIRAILLQKHGIAHPFQELADAAFLQNKDGSLKLAKEVNLKFSKRRKQAKG